MILVSVHYPNDPATKFDEGYYMQKHIPLVRDRWGGMGMQDIRVLRGAGAPGGGPTPWRIIALLTFDSMEAFGRCAEAHGPELFGDIPNFTNSQPVVQISEPLG